MRGNAYRERFLALSTIRAQRRCRGLCTRMYDRGCLAAVLRFDLLYEGGIEECEAMVEKLVPFIDGTGLTVMQAFT
jgi:hypothetical protein